MVKKYNQYIKENNIVYSSDEIDPYGEEDWDDVELTPVLKIAKREGLPYDQIIGLDCSNKGLTSLEGIENLVKLKYFNCGSNNLTNLKGIENLFNLKELRCQNNNLTNLEGIENLINLKTLNCFNNNLTTLEGIENNNNLQYLRCHNNHFSDEYKQYLKDYCENKNIKLYL